MSRVEEALNRARGVVAEPATSVPLRVIDRYPSEVGPASSRSRDGMATRAGAPLAQPADIAAQGADSAPLALARAVHGKVVVGADAPPATVEEYRRLAAAFHLKQTQTNIRALMISSALPRDGKSLTSTNLALTLSESYKRRVLLIDADLRRPSIRDVFQLRVETGLSEVLHADAGGALPLTQVSPCLSILTAGHHESSPLAALVSDRMGALIAEAVERFDWVILDTPPVGLLPDANLLARLVDGVVLVIGAGSTPYTAVARAVAEFGRERVLGVVLNRVSSFGRFDKAYGSYYHRPPTAPDLELRS